MPQNVCPKKNDKDSEGGVETTTMHNIPLLMEPKMHTIVLGSHILLSYQDYSQPELSNIFHVLYGSKSV